jgi:hypothetical protein
MQDSQSYQLKFTILQPIAGHRLPPVIYQRLSLMKVDVTYDALLRTLIEMIRSERDQGKALMSLMSRLMEGTGQQGALANAPGQTKKKRPTRRRAKPAGTAKATARKTRPAAKSAPARKAKGSTQAIKSRATANPTKPAATVKSASRTKTRRTTKSAAARRATGMAQPTKKTVTSRLAKPARAAKSTTPVKLTAKTTPARKLTKPAKAVRNPVSTGLAKPASTPKAVPLAKAKPAAVLPSVGGGQGNGLGQEQTSRRPETLGSGT